MCRTISMAEAQATFPDLIDALAPGETVVITQDNQPVATLTRNPLTARKSPQFGSARGKLMIHVEDDEHLKDFAEYMSADCPWLTYVPSATSWRTEWRL